MVFSGFKNLNKRLGKYIGNGHKTDINIYIYMYFISYTVYIYINIRTCVCLNLHSLNSYMTTKHVPSLRTTEQSDPGI